MIVKRSVVDNSDMKIDGGQSTLVAEGELDNAVRICTKIRSYAQTQYMLPCDITR